ncbi:MAG TPA: NAD-dependent epimerase/dehydratase family protein [Actinomycetota bacterium]|nr:NAD-dependent epimerase/dehydratase family protein [Actinomycetota bacterium]
MRIFVAGATGVIGVRLVPLLVAEGHEVAGMTRSLDKADFLRELGADPIVCDVYEAEALREAVVDTDAQAIVHLLTDLPDDEAEISRFTEANARIRREGTRNLLAAGEAAGTSRFLAESVAWRLEGDAGAAVDELESTVLGAGGVVLRYGQLYGPGTYFEHEPPDHPRIGIGEAARRTALALEEPSGVIEIVERP